jgi:hypothetical protein
MITSIFKKSSLINYSLVVLLLITLFLVAQIKEGIWLKSIENGFASSLLIILLLVSLFIINFIAKKNGLTKDSSYTILFFTLFLMFFPSILSNLKLIISNFFIFLALRRLISLQTLKAPKEKIFDASLWIFAASLFHFWAILFIILVYISIFFHVSRDYRNWLIPFVSFFVTVVIYLFFSLLLNNHLINNIENFSIFDLRMDYFKNIYQNLAISMYAVIAVYFVFSKIISLTNRPLVLQASYKKIVIAFFIGIAIFILSPNKSNDILVFTFFPLSIMATNNIEYSKNKIQQELALIISIIMVFCCFFLQL